MSFLWPPMLLSLLALPVLVVVYLMIQRRRQANLARIGLARLKPAAPASGARPGLRRHIPPGLFLLGLGILLFALARPQAKINLPRVEGTVVLVFDVSASMGATDVEPSRIEAAKAAAREFILSQPETVKIGIVSFSASGFTVQPPSNDANRLLAAVDRLAPTSGTSLGQGILAALNTIAVDAGLAPANPDENASGDTSELAETEEDAALDRARLETELLDQLPEGAYPPAVIVLLSDGENNQSIDPLIAAEAAQERSVRVDALGFGTSAGTTLELDGFSVHTALDEATLRAITQAAGGSYYPAQSEQDPKEIYAKLTPELVIKPEAIEITSVLAGASLLVLLLGSLFSMALFNRPL